MPPSPRTSARRCERRRLPQNAAPRAAALAALLGACVAGAAAAQSTPELVGSLETTPVALVADTVEFDERSGLLTASGAVEVYQGARTLTASSIVYDSASGRIRAEGPLALRDGAGTTLLADSAEIDGALRDGIVTGARALIGGGAGAMAAVEGRRIDGRYTALSRVTYSSCVVCAASPTPLWSIRANRVIHDQVARDVHYEDPVFEVLGVPVAWLPYFSHADPGVKRRSGFLAPEFKRASTYGVATRIPYFIVLDDTRDATITAFPTSKDGPILEGEYRQRFDNGGFTLAGSIGALDIEEGQGREVRSHIFGDGRFDVSALGFGAGAVAGFDLALTSDDGYLRRYDFTNDDRLTTEVFLERFGARDYFSLAAVSFQSLREGESGGSIPFALPEFAIRQVVDERVTGGEVGFEASGVALTRTDGRDVARFSLGVDYDREVIADIGLVLRGFGAARADFYHVADDPAFDTGVITRLAPHVGAEARYPLIARGEGLAHLLEPVAQLVVAPNGLNNSEIPNEDSLIVEFDETNLLDPNRFPGFDQVESGARVNLGLRYARIADDPFILDASMGRVFRLSEESSFSPGSGLVDNASDYVGAWTVGYAPWFTVSNRFRVSDSLTVARNEFIGHLEGGPVTLDAGYVFLAEDAVAGALDDREEATLDATLALDRNWSLRGFARRDMTNDAFIRASGAIAYRNECAALELFVERDFTDTTDSPPSTNVGVRVRLFGAADGAGARSAVCGPAAVAAD